jgi:hypothetical protein
VAKSEILILSEAVVFAHGLLFARVQRQKDQLEHHRLTMKLAEHDCGDPDCPCNQIDHGLREGLDHWKDQLAMLHDANEIAKLEIAELKVDDGPRTGP